MVFLSTDIYESELTEDSKQVAVSVAGYIAKSLSKSSKCKQCKQKLIAKQIYIDRDDYLRLLLRDGLIQGSYRHPSTIFLDQMCKRHYFQDMFCWKTLISGPRG